MNWKFWINAILCWVSIVISYLRFADGGFPGSLQGTAALLTAVWLAIMAYEARRN